MELSGYRVKYFEDGQKMDIAAGSNAHYTVNTDITDESIRASITARSRIQLHTVSLVFDYKFLYNDKFFGNGYQSWTTSLEYRSTDSMKDVIPIAVTKRLRNTAGISGDTRFVDFPKKKGCFYSHCYTYIRNGADVNLIGSLTEKQGFTVIYADMIEGKLTISKDVEGVTLEEGETYELLDAVNLKGTYDEVFYKYFGKMNLPAPRTNHLAGYTSWYNYFKKIDEDTMFRDLTALDTVKDSVNIFQIDDGYETAVGDWLELNKEDFPSGMKEVADRIHRKGYKAGIWLAPFNCQTTSLVFRNHRDWLVKDSAGLPRMGVINWGGAYVLDIYNDNARNYIKHFFDVILNEWGYDMVKLDFLYSQCLYPRNNKSRGTIMCEAMAFLRECCGDKLILGCGVPLGAAFGYVDACRVGCDVDIVYGGRFYNALHVNNEIPSAKNSITNAIFRRHLNGRAFCNDPDVFFLRYSNLQFNMDQKKLLAGVNHIFGDVLFVSDNAEEYEPEDVKLLKKAFSESSCKVVSADLEGKEGRIVLDFDGNERTLYFDLETGDSNIDQVLFNN